MAEKTRLELTWIGKSRRPRIEPRILIEDSAKSHHASARRTDDIFDNILIHGDNLLALKAIEPGLRGSVKCIYIDPPFNTLQALEYYDDGIEHSIWLSLMRERLSILRELLTPDGTIFIHIDDNELAYLTVLCDEIFGRENRAYIVTFKQGSATGHKSINPGCVSTTNFILVYARDRTTWAPNRVYSARDRDVRYNQFIRNISLGFERWDVIPLMTAFADSAGLLERDARKAARDNPGLLDEFVMRNAESVVRWAQPDYDAVGKDIKDIIDKSKAAPGTWYALRRDDHDDVFVKNGQRALFYSSKLKMIDGVYVSGEPITTLWDDLLSNNLHKEGGVHFPKGKKPEALIKRCIELSTSPGEIVLDSFAGSGTTGAVAHKMGRRWVMIELKDHCESHIAPRLNSVIDGTDRSGITEAVGWKGGGGYRYHRLAPSLLEKDAFGQWVISPSYNAEMLAEAMCVHFGFNYAPSAEHYWMQGRSSETDFIYVTTSSLTHEQLKVISEEVGPERSLLICCKAFQAANVDTFANLTVRKIPGAVLDRCEWGKDDYSLKVANLPMAEDVPEPELKASARADPAQPNLFAPEAAE